jgi:hypothetical protein
MQGAGAPAPACRARSQAPICNLRHAVGSPRAHLLCLFIVFGRRVSVGLLACIKVVASKGAHQLLHRHLYICAKLEGIRFIKRTPPRCGLSGSLKLLDLQPRRSRGGGAVLVKTGRLRGPAARRTDKKH